MHEVQIRRGNNEKNNNTKADMRTPTQTTESLQKTKESSQYTSWLHTEHKNAPFSQFPTMKTNR